MSPVQTAIAPVCSSASCPALLVCVFTDGILPWHQVPSPPRLPSSLTECPDLPQLTSPLCLEPRFLSSSGGHEGLLSVFQILPSFLLWDLFRYMSFFLVEFSVLSSSWGSDVLHRSISISHGQPETPVTLHGILSYSPQCAVNKPCSHVSLLCPLQV